MCCQEVSCKSQVRGADKVFQARGIRTDKIQRIAAIAYKISDGVSISL